ncbi:MAG: methylated-DNA--[protein]-cysteine S-methyltransferase [Actinomycetota bacterium]|nr:methylated-DNA--[protein]-cysteine S-methyltransferase [Actinomycetota bacterium]
MPADSFALFDTAMGRCGIAWGARGIIGVQLPEADERATRASMLRRCVGRCVDADEMSPPPTVQYAIDGIVALLNGEADDFSKAGDLCAIELDMDRVPPFHRRVYQIARTIAPGETMTYGEIAAQLGSHGSARAVGQALARNPFAIVVPCHRVLAAGDKLGGFSANGGATTKLRLLSIERAHAGEAPTLFDSDGTFGLTARVAVERG